MTFRFLGPDPVEEQVERLLTRLAAGEKPEDIEPTQVEVKEEPGRRDGATVLPAAVRSEIAAKFLAGVMACMANTPGGGAVILGVADDGLRVGTDIDADWLRHRLYELTERKLHVEVRPVDMEGTRLLVLTTHEAIEPIPRAGRFYWRVDDNCVEVDPTTWHTSRLWRSGADWSSMASGHTLHDISPVAAETARRYLRAAGDDASLDLASATDHELIRRLNVVDGEGRLTNAGSLLFVGTPHVGVDYIRRDLHGADSTLRVRSTGPLLEQVWDVDQASQASNRMVHTMEGFAAGQVRAIPTRALREAIVNGVAHRDWLSAQATTVEHVGDELVVTSPGGFISPLPHRVG